MSKPVRVAHNASNGRVVEVNIDGKQFSTPTRAIHHRELQTLGEILKYREKGQLSAIEPLPHEVQETVIDFRVTDFERLSADNKYFAYQKQKVKSLSGNGNRRLKICNVRIVSQEEPIARESIHMLTVLQANSESLDMITVPDPNCVESSGNQLQEGLSVARKTLDDSGLDDLQIIPFLDLKTDPLALRDRFKALLDMGYYAIGIRFRSGHEPSARQVSLTLSDKDVWVHLAGVPKKLFRRPIIPQIHLMPFFSFDSISSFKGFGAPLRKENDEFRMPKVPERGDPDPKAEGIMPIRTGPVSRDPDPRFDSLSLGFLDREEHYRRFGSDLNCDCFLCRNHDLHTFYEEYGIESGKTSHQKLKKHLLTHELHASYRELQSSQKFIRELGYKEYLRQKAVIQDYGSTINEIDSLNLTDFF